MVDECASYCASLNGIKDYCDKEEEEDCRCSLVQDKRCGYFEKAVLPMNPQLEALFKAKEKGYKLSKEDRARMSPVKGKVKIHCKKCKKPFLADNYRQQYCEFCKKFLQRERKRIWKAKVGK